MYFIEVKIPKEIRQYKESIFFGLSARQFFCSLIAVLIAAGVYLLLGKVIGKESASWLCIVLAAPAAMAGFFSYNGMTFEQFLSIAEIVEKSGFSESKVKTMLHRTRKKLLQQLKEEGLC